MFKQFLNKLHQYEIRIRKAVNSARQGNFHSVFKGSGIDFTDLRLYQYGDDIRAIDWNTSAKGHGTYIKLFKEEKEQTVFFLLDISGSQMVGQPNNLKIDIAKEICGVLTLSAVKEASQVGLLCFTDQNEMYIRPATGMKQAYRIISNLYKTVPVSLGTSLSKFLLQTLDILRKKSLVFIISDFIDDGYEMHLKALARKHDVIVIHIHDSREHQLPSLGIIPVYDIETGSKQWINTSSPFYKHKLSDSFKKRAEKLELLCRQNNADYLSVDTNTDYVQTLIRLFKVRRFAKHSKR